MLKCIFVIIVFICLASCKSLKHNDKVINYHYVGPGSDVSVIGDFQEFLLFQNHKIRIMPAYFREFGSLKNSLIVRIQLEKKFGLKSQGIVVSKTFDSLCETKHEWSKKNDATDDIIYSTSLKNMDLLKRKEAILNDTITIKIGHKQFLFTPKSTRGHTQNGQYDGVGHPFFQRPR